MTLVKSNNGGLIPRIPFLFDDIFARDLNDWSLSNFSHSGSTLPKVNIRETHDDYQIEVAAPGMKKDDFQVELDNNLLVISSEKQSSEESGKNGYTRREFSYESFRRSFSLPANVVEADKILAKYQDGILRLVVPKKAEAKTKPTRTIKIS
jgi:HSP20 family protein